MKNRKFSPAFMAALLGMSVLTHAHAEPDTLSQEEIERMFLDEVKVPGKTMRCFQAGQEIIHETGLRDFEITQDIASAKRLDGSRFEIIMKDGSTTCIVITR